MKQRIMRFSFTQVFLLASVFVLYSSPIWAEESASNTTSETRSDSGNLDQETNASSKTEAQTQAENQVVVSAESEPKVDTPPATVSPIEPESTPVEEIKNGSESSSALTKQAQRSPAKYWSFGDLDRYVPVTRMSFGGVRIELPVTLRHSFRQADAIDLGDGIPAGEGLNARFAPSPALDFQARLAANLETRKLLYPISLSAHYEQDFMTGVYHGGEANVEGVAYPNERPCDPNQSEGTLPCSAQLRKAYANLSLASILTLRAGYMTSHWGLGLLANDGAHGWTPESAYFGDPRNGDRVLRFMAATGPHRILGRPTLVTVAIDQVQGDDIMLEGDRAEQSLAALVWGYGQNRQIGAYVVNRHQEILTNDQNKTTDVWVFDLYTQWGWALSDSLRLQMELEGVFIDGDTTLAPSPEYPSSEVRQAALATRIKLSGDRMGGVFDMIIASGDQNFDDGRQSVFKADPNYEMGLLLFKHVIAAQTARAPATASDLSLVGQPNEDLERFPTRGSVSNTYTFFPRAWYRLASGLEVYGGPLLAWGEVPLADPRNTRFNGGYPANLLAGNSGERFLGVEADIGLRGQVILGGIELMLGAEGGALFTGPAFKGEDGQGLGTIYGGRFITQLRF